MTEVDRCCKKIVGIDLPECCLGTEFILHTAAAYYEGMLDVAGASRVTAPGAVALSHTPKKPHTQADPPPADPADEPAPRWRPPRRRGSAGAQEPEPAAPPPKAGGKGGVHARRWQINLVVLDERCAVVCCAEFHLQAGAGQPDKLMTWIGDG